jgi:hypothetical protein
MLFQILRDVVAVVGKDFLRPHFLVAISIDHQVDWGMF